MKRNGISLIVLVITIVVVIILAAAVILSLGENNPMSEARLANVLQEKDSIESAVLTHVSAISSKEAGQYETYEIITGKDKLGNDLENYKIITDDISDVVIVYDNGKSMKLYKIDQTRFKNKTALKISDNISGANWYVNEYGKVFLMFPTEKSAPNYMVDSNGIMTNENLKTFVSHKQNATLGEGVLGENVPPILNATASDVANTPKSFYGKKVKNYTATNSSAANWLIFHSDGNNIYLIADNPVSLSYVPNGKGTTNKPTSPVPEGLPNAGILSENIFSGYTGTGEITDSRLKALNSQYFDKITSANTNYIGKVMAYMFDTNAWGGFAGTSADYAIGGPSVELLLASYSKKYKNNNLRTRVEETNYEYQMSSDSGLNYSYLLTGVIPETDTLYIKNYTDYGSPGYWVASPGAYMQPGIVTPMHGYLMLCGLNNNTFKTDVCGTFNNAPSGFRPVICLKSSVTISESGDGFNID